MTTILVWYLVTVGGHRHITYSPPMPTLEQCQHLLNTKPMGWPISAQCVQVQVVKL